MSRISFVVRISLQETQEFGSAPGGRLYHGIVLLLKLHCLSRSLRKVVCSSRALRVTLVVISTLLGPLRSCGESPDSFRDFQLR